MNVQANPNKQLRQDIFASLAQGDAKPFVDSLAEDFYWSLTGNTKWSGTHRGRNAVMGELMRESGRS